MSLRDHATAPAADVKPDPVRERTISKQSLPNVGDSVMFRLVDPNDVFIFVQWWLGVARKSDTGEVIYVPFRGVKNIEAHENVGRDGRKWFNRTIPNDLLSKYYENGHPLVAVNSYGKADAKTGRLPANVNKVFAWKVQLVELVKDAAGKIVMEAGRPKMKVDPVERLVQLNQSIFDQVVDQLEPRPATDTTGEAEVFGEVRKALPPVTGDPKLAVWRFSKRVADKPTGNAKMDVRYDLLASTKFSLLASEVPAVTESMGSWDTMFPALTDAKVKEMADKLMDGTGVPAANEAIAAGGSVPGASGAAPLANEMPGEVDPLGFAL